MPDKEPVQSRLADRDALDRKRVAQLEQGSIAVLSEPCHDRPAMGLCLSGISISAKRARSNIPLAKLQISPAADACGTHAKPFGGLAVGRTSGNSSNHANTQIDRKGFRHIRRPPSADSLNQNPPDLQSPADSLSQGTALERAALLLHDVFGLPFEEIAETLDRDVAACRQLAARARRNVREARTRYTIDAKRGLEMAEAFFTASRSGDMTALSAMLAADVGLHSDGGGKRQAAIAPILGHEAVMKVHTYLSEKIWPAGSALLRVGLVNGLPGFVTREADGELQTTALQIEDGAITAIYVMRNPDKLRHLQ